MINLINSDTLQKPRLKSARAGKFNLRLRIGEVEPDNLKPSAAYYSGRLLNNRILAAFGDDYGFANLMSHSESISLAAGDELYAAGENNDYVYFPETAVVSHLYNLADGNAVEIAMVGSEGASGLCAVLGSQPTVHQAMVTINGAARRIKTDVLRQEFSRGGKLQTLLLDYLNAHLAQVSQRVVCESFHSIEKRLCSWLLMLRDRLRKNQLSLTQEQMSQFLGVNRPSLSVVAKTLRDAGLIDYARGKLYILDCTGLQASACECYAAVQTPFYEH